MSNSRWILFRRGIPFICLGLATACNLGFGAPGTTSVSSSTPFLPEGTATSTVTPTETLPEPSATPTETPIPLVYPVGPSGFPANVNPLTGLIVSDPALLDRRPLAIKVTNFPRTARPQAGLSRADILWEFYTEFGNTRWIAMFYGQDAEKVGPIRSARVLDTRIIPLYDAILVHVQAFETVWQEISKTGIDTINEFPASCPAICRDPEEKIIENSALTKYARRIGLLAAGRPNLDGMVFDPAVPADLKPSIGLRITFSSSAMAQWKYDTERKRYVRLSENASFVFEPLADRTTGDQLAVDNLVIIVVDTFRYAGQTGTGEQFDMNLTKSGKAYFFRDGVMLEGRWQSGGPNAPLQFVDANGAQFPLHPGSTYIGILGDRATGASAATTEWYFYNAL
jgi:Protein of unknown function (DUF3048) N-terminal domain/Protein of unknown function (DUF3048) C-terminal domain